MLARTRLNVSFEPVRGEKREESSTTFDLGRWDVPGRCGYRGLALWAECDMLCRADIAELLELYDSRYDVMLVKHDYSTKHPVKFLGQKNEDYPNKNWSSLMLFNCAAAVWHRIDELRPMFEANQLHRFPESIPVGGRKLEIFQPGRIGALGTEWNHLVGEYAPNPEAKVAHFTIGLPCWPEYSGCEFADEWRAERDAMLSFKAH